MSKSPNKPAPSAHTFIVPPPEGAKSFSRYCWWVFTLHLPRLVGFPVSRFYVYGALFIACVTTTITACDPKGGTPYLNLMLILVVGFMQWLVVGSMLTLISERERHVNWKKAEIDAYCDKRIADVLERSERHRALLASSVQAGIKELQAEAGKVDGEEWKNKQRRAAGQDVIPDPPKPKPDDTPPSNKPTENGGDAT